MDLHNREGGAPPPLTHSSLPCTVSDITDMESLINAIKKLSTCITDAVYDSKSVTAANKRLIAATADEIKRVAEIVPRVINAEHRPEPTPQPADDLKSEIISAVRQELADFKRQTIVATTTNQQRQGPASVLCTSCEHGLQKATTITTDNATGHQAGAHHHLKKRRASHRRTRYPLGGHLCPSRTPILPRPEYILSLIINSGSNSTVRHSYKPL
ncbi:unnamed protein product, partial [Brenthis ino]